MFRTSTTPILQFFLLFITYRVTVLSADWPHRLTHTYSNDVMNNLGLPTLPPPTLPPSAQSLAALLSISAPQNRQAHLLA